ncbi:type II toxin-antitoxin system mRNA interferase toxin, RelE/StbE family [Candidatus Parcubacteria bacterium]|nr:type II toxin-antitoxin system mRNA interferase toxin, RelE/StbE family [Candidatus Parcubacteria bacterium]
MKIIFHKNFDKCFSKLTTKQKEKTKERLALFSEYPFNSILNNHPLRGKYTDYRSINITGDLRAIFKLLNPDKVIFVTLGSHSELYR